MFTALGRKGIYELSIWLLMENPEGRLKIPLFLLFLRTEGRRSSVLAPGKPVACPEALLGSPNGSKDRFFEELVLEWLAPLCLYYKVDRNVDLQRGCRQVLKHKTHQKIIEIIKK